MSRGQINRKRREAKALRRAREDRHKDTAKLAARFRECTLTRPASFKEITRAGSGDLREWGAMVRTKAKFNRHVLDQNPGAWCQQIEYKLSEAGAKFTEIIDEDPVAALGNELVAAGKAVRKARRTTRKKGKTNDQRPNT